MAAGLGEIGYSKVFLSPQFGPAQRLGAIITDAPLEEDPLYSGSSLCKRCFKCVDACPVGALSKKEKISLRIENKIFEFGKLDRLRCDWAKKYALVGAAGPKYMSSKTDILPPEKITGSPLRRFKTNRPCAETSPLHSGEMPNCLSG